MHPPTTQHAPPGTSLSARQLAIAPVTAWAAVGDMPRLRTALEQALDAGMSIQEAKELLVQVYAYAGFPRSLNALGELMQLVDARRQRGVQDAAGREPGAVPKGDALLALGTANQSRLAGGPVTGPLFDFAPAIDVFLKSHLFGDIFARDNLDWQSREIATVGMLAAMPGVDSQLQAHMRISLNTGLTPSQLQQVVQVLTSQVDAASGARAQAALVRQLRVHP
ncbi:carboxymuconolactone decarboxylase family protein [Comamonas terrigena]|nr:carboxymuconolactone decarboxylase family protein [Comamonas terrigena]MDH1701518.1 carboxymuconolactone decarboxylase family protein [Comamonas terrigena]